jgi:hypothetical protein
MMSRGLEAARALYGAGLLLAPSQALARGARSPLDRPAVVVARVLGARDLLQAAILWERPAPRWRLSGAAVDAAHAASMLALARWSRMPTRRRLAARNARTASLFAGIGAVEAASDFQRSRAGIRDGETSAQPPPE